MAKPNKNRLGRGLEALLTPPDEVTTSGSSSISEIELTQIEPNPDQPRSIFEEDTLNELAQSIRTYGVIQPIILKDTGSGKYLIIAGERRYRAAVKAGLEKIPAYIKTAADENIAEIALNGTGLSETDRFERLHTGRAERTCRKKTNNDCQLPAPLETSGRDTSRVER